jgi:hypothetical protein
VRKRVISRKRKKWIERESKGESPKLTPPKCFDARFCNKKRGTLHPEGKVRGGGYTLHQQINYNSNLIFL